VCLWLAGPTFSSLLITGTHYIAIDMPFVTWLIHKDLRDRLHAVLIDSGRFLGKILPKNVDSKFRIGPSDRFWTDLALAIRAIVGSAPRQLNAPDGRLAEAARLARTLVDAVFELKEAPLPVGVHIIRNRRTAQADGVGENLAEREAQPLQFRRAQPIGQSARPDARLKKALVRVDVADSGEEGLVQQCRLDGHAPLAEELGKRSLANRQRFGSRRFKCRVSAAAPAAAQIAKLQPAEAPRIHKSQLVAAGQVKPRVRMRGNGSIRRRNQ
jgi:hypothetical protein